MYHIYIERERERARERKRARERESERARERRRNDACFLSACNTDKGDGVMWGHTHSTLHMQHQVIRADPTGMSYTAVFNLCTLYDLQVTQARSVMQRGSRLVRDGA
jgi:hypothetical protein